MGYDETKIDQAVQSVWTSLLDAELKSLMRPKFEELTEYYELNAEEAEDAWYEFGERRARVFWA